MTSINSGETVLLATAGYDHTIRFWSTQHGICTRTVQHQDSQINDLEFTPDKQLVAAAGYQHVRMYDVYSGNPNPVCNYNGMPKNVTAVGFHEDGKWMYTGGEDNSARIWDLRSRNGQCQKVFQVNSPVNCVALHPNQGELFVGDQTGIIHIWDLKTDRNEQLCPETDSSIQSLAVDSEGSYLAALNNKGVCYIWALTGGRSGESTQAHPKAKLQAHKKYGLKCLFSPDSTLLATTSADMTTRIWKTVDFTQVMELKDNNQRWVWDCAFTVDSQYIITASSDNTARLWDVASGKVKREFSGHQKALVCLAFRDDCATD